MALNDVAPSPKRSLLTTPLPAPAAQLRRDLQALGFFTLVTLLLLYRMVLNLDGFAGDPGDPLLNSWILAWDTHALLARLPYFFNANIFFPYSLTLAYSETLLGDLPIAAPIIALTHNPLLAHNVLVLLSFIAGGWFMYFTVSRLTGSGWAGLVAGAIFAYQLERFAGFTHLQLLTTQWLPLVLYCLDRVLTQGRWRYWLGLVIFFNLQFLSSYYVGIFMSVTLVLLLAGYLALKVAQPTRKMVWQITAFAAVTAAINIPLAAPYFTLARQLKLERTVGDLVGLSGSPRDYITASPTHWLYGALGRTFDPGHLRGGEHYLFLGVTVWLLVLVGLLWRGGEATARRKALLMLGVLGVLVLLSWGPQLGGLPLPYRLLFDHVPGFKSIRVPARLIIMVATLAAMIAGFAATRLLDRLGKWRQFGGMSLCLLVVAEAGFLANPGVIVPAPNQGPEVYQWLAKQPDDPVILELPIPSNDLLQAYMQATRQYYSTVHWKRMVNGYSGFLTQTYLQIGGAAHSFPNEATLQWLQGLRVNLVVLTPDAYQTGDWERIAAALPAWAPRLNPIIAFDNARVLQVALPEWNAGAERPQFGEQLRLLGYAVTQQGVGKRVLRLYWQLLTAPPECELVLQAPGGEATALPLAAGGKSATNWPIGEVEVQEVPLPAATSLNLTVRNKSTQRKLAITSGMQQLDAVRLLSLR